MLLRLATALRLLTRAGEGNRTLVFSLEGYCSTIELHPPDHLQDQRFRAGHPALLQWGVQDSNLRRLSQRIYSPSPLTTRETPRTQVLTSQGGPPQGCSFDLTPPTCVSPVPLPALYPFPSHDLAQTGPPKPRPRSQRRESNPRPADYKSAALPTELRWHFAPQRQSPRCENQLIYCPHGFTQDDQSKKAHRQIESATPCRVKT